MARNFVTANNNEIIFPVLTSTVNSGTTHTGLAKIRVSSLGLVGHVLAHGELGVNGPFDSLITLQVDNTIRALIQTTPGGTQTALIATTQTVSVDTWHSVGIRRDGDNVTAHLDTFVSAVDSPAGTFGTNSNYDDFRVGELANLGGHFEGDIAEVAYWDVALTDDEIASYHAGASPLTIRPGNLTFYAPLFGVLGASAGEPDFSGNANNSTGLGGTPGVVSNPPVSKFAPRQRILTPVAEVLAPYAPPIHPEVNFAMEFLVT